MVSPFTPRDLAELERHGISPAEAARQLALLERPPPPIRLLRPCTIGDGIRRIDADDPELLDAYRSSVERGRLTRFIPASGAATRMFADLLTWLEAGDQALSPAAQRLLDELDRLPFYAELEAHFQRRGQSLAELRRRRAALPILRALLDRNELAMAERPKALLPFHRRSDGRIVTAFEEHLAEAAELLEPVPRPHPIPVHFTVSPPHRRLFEERWQTLAPELEERYGRFRLDFSEQAPSTDTLALECEPSERASTPSGAPLRQRDGSLVWRPGGHGALIDNLAALAQGGADLVMIKNIDNVLSESRRAEGNRIRRAVLGLLVRLQAAARDHTDRLAHHPSVSELEAAARFLRRELCHPHAEDLLDRDRESCRGDLFRLLDRPLRLCGMVPNLGEPGGGPFWVAGASPGSGAPGASLQIVETSQIDLTDTQQANVLSRSTHFNPVELYCALCRFNGQPFDLETFVDPTTSFISRRSHEGRAVVALERPGLWNGAMAGWNTVFVELPALAFAPVKTVFDLLRPEHQP